MKYNTIFNIVLFVLLIRFELKETNEKMADY